MQMYSCPKCGYPLAFADRFCSHCGICLNWVILQETPGDAGNQRARDGGSTRLSRADTSSGGSVTPLTAGVSKLLADFFDKHERPDKVRQTQ